MTENNVNKDMNKYLFINLVTMLSMSAMQQLGKIISPGAAGKAEINLDAAQATIDTIDMLSAKTLGNLDKDEARMMKDTLSMLKMNFVETKEMKNEKPAQSGGAEEAKPEPQSQKPEGQGKSSEAKPEEEEPPKFHKSYS